MMESVNSFSSNTSTMTAGGNASLVDPDMKAALMGAGMRVRQSVNGGYRSPSFNSSSTHPFNPTPLPPTTTTNTGVLPPSSRAAFSRTASTPNPLSYSSNNDRYQPPSAFGRSGLIEDAEEGVEDDGGDGFDIDELDDGDEGDVLGGNSSGAFGTGAAASTSSASTSTKRRNSQGGGGADTLMNRAPIFFSSEAAAKQFQTPSIPPFRPIRNAADLYNPHPTIYPGQSGSPSSISQPFHDPKNERPLDRGLPSLKGDGSNGNGGVTNPVSGGAGGGARTLGKRAPMGKTKSLPASAFFGGIGGVGGREMMDTTEGGWDFSAWAQAEEF